MTSSTELLRTPLHDWHVSHGGRMVDFAGWSMPVQYKSIADEHHATRKAVGVFDISHMGRLQFSGENSARFLDGLTTRRVSDLKPNQIRYSLICNDDGGILDDVLVYGVEDAVYPILHRNHPTLSMVVNASNREKIVGWLNQHVGESGVGVKDITIQSAMIAVQGPRATSLMEQLLVPGSQPLSSMRYYTYGSYQLLDRDTLISRTGYTGDDGVEIICDDDDAAEIWERIVDAVSRVGGMAAGLGARDTLRLEAAMPLYGHELSETINPIQAGLNFAVNLPGRDFVGRAAIEKFAADENQPVRIGLQVEGKRVARQGSAVLHSGEIVGEVTSGTFSPTFDRPIAMAYVRPTATAIGTHLAVDIRGTQHAATVVPLPFYERGRKN